MLKIIHGADFHLDSPFSGLPPEQAALRRSEQRLLLQDLADLARLRQADLVLLAGDLLDSEQVFRETARTLSDTLGTIPCPVFIAPGNHDFYSPRSVYATLDWPENVHIFRSLEMEPVKLSQLNCTVYGRAFTAPHQSESPLDGFRARRNGDGLQLACLHGDTAPRSDYAPITPEHIADSGLDYLALGHIHRCSGLQRSGDTHWAYPGCPEGRGFDEAGEKGVLFVELEHGRIQEEFIPLSRHRYQTISVDVTDRNPLSAVLDALPSDTRTDIYRIFLTGECETLSSARLENSLRSHFFSLDLQDHTRLPRDLWARRDEDSLSGLFLQTMWKKIQADPDDTTLQLAVRFGLAALEGGEEVAP